MSNTIQIKSGSGKPTGKLLANELGYDQTNGYLYIGNASNQTVGIKVDHAITSDYVSFKDTRSEEVTPNNSLEGLSIHLKTNGKDSLSDGGTYHTVLSAKGWNDHSGGPYWQSSVTANNNMYFRKSTSGTAWGSWQKVLSDNNYTSYTVKKDGTGASGTWGISISGNAATATSATSAKTATTATSASSAEKLNANAGSSSKPIYFSSGKPVECSSSLNISILGSAASADKLSSSAGSSTKPIYFSGGKPVQCSNTLAVNISGNAATATSATSATRATTATKLSSTLAIGSGGTGATTAAAARTNLGLKYTRILAAGSWVTTCSWSGDFDFIIGLAAPDSDSTMSKCAFVLPKAFLGSTFQVADEATYSAFSTTSTSITYSKGHAGRLACVFGVKVG